MAEDTTQPESEEPWDNEKQKDASKYPEHEASASDLREGDAPQAPSPEHPFDLEERTAKFGEAILLFVKKMPLNPRNNRVIDQLVGCGTSIGANYCEADEAVSKKEFINKIGTCKKEAKETKFFLRMAATAEPDLKPEARQLWREAKELHLIFSKIFRSGREGRNDQ